MHVCRYTSTCRGRRSGPAPSPLDNSNSLNWYSKIFEKKHPPPLGKHNYTSDCAPPPKKNLEFVHVVTWAIVVILLIIHCCPHLQYCVYMERTDLWYLLVYMLVNLWCNFNWMNRIHVYICKMKWHTVMHFTRIDKSKNMYICLQNKGVGVNISFFSCLFKIIFHKWKNIDIERWNYVLCFQADKIHLKLRKKRKKYIYK